MRISGPDRFQLRREFASAHLGHDHVAQKEVNRARMAARAIASASMPALGFQHGVALDAQELASQFAHARFVLDDQNRLAASRNRGGLFLRLGICRLARGLRKINFKRRALPGRTVHPNEAAALLHHAINRRQPQSRSFADFLGGEKRLENMGFGRLVHAVSGVADREQHVPPGSHGRPLRGLRFIHRTRSTSGPRACRRSGMASRALTARFKITCSICPGSAFTEASFGSGKNEYSMCSPIRRGSILPISATTAFKSSTRG